MEAKYNTAIRINGATLNLDATKTIELTAKGEMSLTGKTIHENT
jgi:hypothetical protein